MLRLFDSGAGRARPVRAARAGQLHIFLASPAATGQITAGDVRAALLADLVHRAAERHHLRVTTWQPEPAPPAWPQARDLLNIYPAQPGPLPGPPDVLVSAEPPAAGTHRVWPAPALPLGTAPDDLAARGLDPLALRLALLRHHHQQPAVLDPGALGAADACVREWRRQVAGWARSPSRPMCAGYVAGVTAAFDDDLATPAALAALGALAGDETVPPGSKFETFAYLDRLLGLDLARDVGR